MQQVETHEQSKVADSLHDNMFQVLADQKMSTLRQKIRKCPTPK
jgi:hypothetical protein